MTAKTSDASPARRMPLSDSRRAAKLEQAQRALQKALDLLDEINVDLGVKTFVRREERELWRETVGAAGSTERALAQLTDVIAEARR